MLFYDWFKGRQPEDMARCQGCDAPLPTDLEDLRQLLDAGWHVWGDKEQVFFCPNCVTVD